MAAPPQRPDLVRDAIEVVLEERVPVWSVGLGLPSGDLIVRCHERGVCIVVMVQAALEQDIWAAATRDNNADYFPQYAGQSVGVTRDLPTAGDVVRSMRDR